MGITSRGTLFAFKRLHFSLHGILAGSKSSHLLSRPACSLNIATKPLFDHDKVTVSGHKTYGQCPSHSSDGSRRQQQCVSSIQHIARDYHTSRILQEATQSGAEAEVTDNGAAAGATEAIGEAESAGAVEQMSADASPYESPRTSLRAMKAAKSNARSLAAARQQQSTRQLEISKEAKETFEAIWSKVETQIGHANGCHLPKEIVWLNGAPGAGKGANTPFILKTRGFQAKAIQVSDLLADSEDVATIMKSGGLVSDSLVLELLLQAVLDMPNAEPIATDVDCSEAALEAEEGAIVAGVVVDGFPRTTIQVDFVKLLYDKLMELHYKHLNTPLENHYPRPIFRIAVLYVEEEESVRRQLARGRAAISHNQRVADSCVGDLKEVRPTDLDERAARRRYQIFREHYDTLLRLKAFFPFHLIDGMGTLSECREQIEKELQYQSALELEATTFRAISHLPLAKDIAKQARQQMVTRLDAYEKHAHHTFKQVIDIISEDIVPIIRRCALAGIAVYNTERTIFFEKPEAAEMLADILSERGYYVTWQARTREVPVRVDPQTFNVMCMRRTTLQFRIKFDRPQIRSAAADQLATPHTPPLRLDAIAPRGTDDQIGRAEPAAASPSDVPAVATSSSGSPPGSRGLGLHPSGANLGLHPGPGSGEGGADREEGNGGESAPLFDFMQAEMPLKIGEIVFPGEGGQGKRDRRPVSRFVILPAVDIEEEQQQEQEDREGGKG